jgi:hypothetical protein
MLESIQLSDERSAKYATASDLCVIFTEEMQSLYLLAFLLTADKQKAERCFLFGLGECAEGLGVFMERAHSWARRAITKQAIEMIMPAPDGPDDMPFLGPGEAATSGGHILFNAIVALSPFERFVYVMSILERQTEEDCSRLLRCAKRDVMIAREVVLQRLAYTDTKYDRSEEPVHTHRAVCATHHA